jgi:toxin ParE1/3/4
LAALYAIPAKRDLVEIWVYIAEDNMDAADAMDSRIRRVCDKLDQAPAMGKLRPELGVEIRSFGVGTM